MLKTIPAAEAKNKFGLLMDTVQREAVEISSSVCITTRERGNEKKSSYQCRYDACPWMRRTKISSKNIGRRYAQVFGWRRMD